MNMSTNTLRQLLQGAEQLNHDANRDQIITDSDINPTFAQWLLSAATAALHNEPVTIHFALVHHRHGTNHYAATTEEELWRALNGYADEWWDEISDENGNPLEKPSDPNEAREMYFEHHCFEHYEIGTADLI